MSDEYINKRKKENEKIKDENVRLTILYSKIASEIFNILVLDTTFFKEKKSFSFMTRDISFKFASIRTNTEIQSMTTSNFHEVSN
jgi:hypothetical protein